MTSIQATPILGEVLEIDSGELDTSRCCAHCGSHRVELITAYYVDDYGAGQHEKMWVCLNYAGHQRPLLILDPSGVDIDGECPF